MENTSEPHRQKKTCRRVGQSIDRNVLILLIAVQKALLAKSGGNWLQVILNEPLMVASVKKGADENIMRQDI